MIAERERARQIGVALAGLAGALVVVAVAGEARSGPTDGSVQWIGVRLLSDLVLVILGLMVIAGIAGLTLGWVIRARSSRYAYLSRAPWWVVVLMGVVNGLLLGAFAALFLVGGSEFLRRVGLAPDGELGLQDPTHPNRHPAGVETDWPAVGAAIVLVVAVAAAWLVSAGTRHLLPLEDDAEDDDPLADLRSVGLDELYGEADPRRAVIRAYAAMAALLGASGLPRLPSETPFEYLDRVLVSLGTSAAAAHRLTVLFEQAKFSHHPVTAGFKDEAIAAVRALRTEVEAEVDAL